MPLLTAEDALPQRPHRVIVAGTSGAGKTTLAACIGEALCIPHIEIDSLFHGHGWTPRATFADDVQAFSSEPDWVTEWQYSTVRDLLAQRADLLVWLDLSRSAVMSRVVRRTLRRRLRRQVLWNGNIEGPLWKVFTDSEHIVRWAWSTHHKSAGRVAAVQQQRPNLTVVRLTNQRDVDLWTSGPLKQVR